MAFRLFERAAWIVGLVALTAWVIVWAAGKAGAQRELDRFAALYSPSSGTSDRSAAVSPDFLLWSPERVEAWRAAQQEGGPAPLGVFRLPRLRIEAPVLTGTDDWTLNRAVGHIEGTPLPGAAGNSGLAAHRDSFFRALKDVAIGDVIELVTPANLVTYRVEHTWIVLPEDVWVLDQTPSAALTLVTCYPFYFIGSAPQRFIVRAIQTTTTPRGSAGKS